MKVVLLLITCLLFAHAEVDKDQKCTGETGSFDIVLALDVSSSVPESQFEQQKQYAVDFVEAFQFGSEGRACVLVYSDSATVVHGFSDTQSNEAIITAIEGLSWDFSSTARLSAVSEAVSVATEQLATSARDFSALILFSDGFDTLGGDVDASGAHLVAAGHTGFSVGIGDFSASTLLAISDGDASHLYDLDDCPTALITAVCDNISPKEFTCSLVDPDETPPDNYFHYPQFALNPDQPYPTVDAEVECGFNVPDEVNYQLDISEDYTTVTLKEVQQSKNSDGVIDLVISFENIPHTVVGFSLRSHNFQFEDAMLDFETSFTSNSIEIYKPEGRGPMVPGTVWTATFDVVLG